MEAAADARDHLPAARRRWPSSNSASASASEAAALIERSLTETALDKNVDDAGPWPI